LKVDVNDWHFNSGKVPVELSFGQWIRLKLRGRVKVFEAIKRGWRGALPFFVFKCKGCGEYALDYLHGYNERLDCRLCDEANSIVRAVNAVFELELEASH